MENKKFDEFIKRSLENLDGEKYIPMDWSAMESQLDNEVNDLDHLVEKSLKDLDGAKYVAMDWSLMENKLDAEIEANSTADSEVDPQLEDIYLDAVAYDHLKNIEPPYNSAHWEIMSARLDEEYAYRRKVILTKALEAVVVLLLVWTAINFFPNKKITPSTVNPVATTHDNTNNLFQQPILQQSSSQNLIAENKTEVPQNSNSTSTSIQEEEFSNTLPTPPINNENAVSLDFSPVKVISIPSNLEDIQDLEAINNTTATKSLSSIDLITSSGTSILKEKLLVQIAALPPLPLSVLPWESNYEEPNSIGKRKLRTHEIFFSMFTSGDVNYVESDFYNTDIRNWDVYQRNRLGYGGGFSVGFQLKRFLVETGASYNFISYQQRDEANIIGNINFGYLEEQWEDAELNIVQVPLNIQYSFLLKKKWKMYSLTGVSLNMAIQNNFNFQLEGPSTAARSPLAKQSTIANQAASYRGILEGGNFRENSYLAANIGFGLERKFTYRWSLFVQPIYQHYFLFEGIGPNQDRIHSGSLRFGAKVKIR